MNARICSVRVRSCASISGTVSGIGSGTSAGSTFDSDSVGAAPPAAGAGGRGAAAVVRRRARARRRRGVGAVLIGVDPATGSFEYAVEREVEAVVGPVGLELDLRGHRRRQRQLADRAPEILAAPDSAESSSSFPVAHPSSTTLAVMFRDTAFAGSGLV